MESVKYCDIPAYLRAGHFFRSLTSDNPEYFLEIPARQFHRDGKSVANLDEFRDLLETMAFWMLDEMPPGILDFCDRTEAAQWVDEIFRFPEAVQSVCFAGLVTAYSATNLGDFTHFVKTSRWEVVIRMFGKMKTDSVATAAAARAGDLRLVQYLHQQGFELHSTTCTNAAYIGDINILRYAHRYGCLWDSQVYDMAAQGDHVECMQYAHEQGLEWSPRALFIAAQFGSLNCLRYALQQGFPLSKDAVTVAVQSGQLDCLEFLLENLCPYDVRICDVACIFHQPACLVLLVEWGAPCDAGTCSAAAQCSDADCLLYLHNLGSPWDANTVRAALLHGQFAPLRYAVENECAHDADSTLCAVKGNSMECLRYVVEEQGFEYSGRTFITALLRGNIEQVKYLIEKDCPFVYVVHPDVEEEDSICDQDFVKNNPNFVVCVEYAVEYGWVPTEHFKRYIMKCDIDNCAELFIRCGWLARESTGQGFVDFLKVRGAPNIDLNPHYVDAMFRQKWNHDFFTRHPDLVRCVFIAVMCGWSPDLPIRHLTGVTLSYSAFYIAALWITILLAHLMGSITAGLFEFIVHWVPFLLRLCVFVAQHIALYKTVCYYLPNPFLRNGAIALMILPATKRYYREVLQVPHGKQKVD